MSDWLRFTLAVLATWRLTHLLSREDGPFDLIVRLRARLGSGFFGRLIDCFYCLSVWVAAPLAFYVSREPVDLVLTWLALTGAACLLERIGQEAVVIEPLAQENEGDVSDGMLWSETSGTTQQAANDQDAGEHPDRDA
jgi:hypothetical protein